MTTPLPPAVMALAETRYLRDQALWPRPGPSGPAGPGSNRTTAWEGSREAASPDIVTGTLSANRSSRLFARLWRLIGYGGRRCYACRTSLVTHHIPATGKHVCAKCAK